MDRGIFFDFIFWKREKNMFAEKKSRFFDKLILRKNVQNEFIL